MHISRTLVDIPQYNCGMPATTTHRTRNCLIVVPTLGVATTSRCQALMRAALPTMCNERGQQNLPHCNVLLGGATFLATAEIALWHL